MKGYIRERHLLYHEKEVGMSAKYWNLRVDAVLTM